MLRTSNLKILLMTKTACEATILCNILFTIFLLGKLAKNAPFRAMVVGNVVIELSVEFSASGGAYHF